MVILIFCLTNFCYAYICYICFICHIILNWKRDSILLILVALVIVCYSARCLLTIAKSWYNSNCSDHFCFGEMLITSTTSAILLFCLCVLTIGYSQSSAILLLCLSVSTMYSVWLISIKGKSNMIIMLPTATYLICNIYIMFIINSVSAYAYIYIYVYILVIRVYYCGHVFWLFILYLMHVEFNLTLKSSFIIAVGSLGFALPVMIVVLVGIHVVMLSMLFTVFVYS